MKKMVQENDKKKKDIKAKKQSEDQATKKNKTKKSSGSLKKNLEKPDEKTQKNQSLLQKIAQKFDENNKIEQKELTIGEENITIFYIESMINKALFSSAVLAPIEKFMQNSNEKTSQNSVNKQSKKSKNNAQKNNSGSEEKDIISQIETELVYISSVEELSEADECIDKIFSGYAVVASNSKAIGCPLFGVEDRAIAEPPTSRVIKGPREGFVENIAINIGLVRKRLKTTDLKIEDIFVGEKTNTQVSIMYLDKVAKPEIISEIKKKIKKINIDAIIDSYYIESFLEDNKLKFFRRVGNTEKPDVFAAKVLEGRVGILVDGSPIALTVPFLLFEDLQSPGDYYSLPAFTTFARIMRIFGLITAILAPGIYVSLQSYNYRILPINFLIALLSSIEGLSIPPLIEILFVLLLFEVITEASLQMPSALGMALSIIGALALGSTAVEAGLISAPSIVIVAISSVALYIIPDQISQTRLIRLLFTIVGGVIGLYGIVVSFMLLTTYLTSVSSFGVPYMAPYAPNIVSDRKDGFIKEPVNNMKTRPSLISYKNKIRQGGKPDDI